MERLLGYAAMAEQVRPSSGAIMPHQVQTLHTCSLVQTFIPGVTGILVIDKLESVFIVD